MPELPVGDPVAFRPARAPSGVPLRGRWVALEPLDPAMHAAALFAASHGSPAVEALWTYMPYGPFDDELSMREWLDGIAGSSDPQFFAVLERESGAPVGMVSYLNVDTAMRHVEFGHIWFAPAAQRTRTNTEAMSLMLEQAFEELGNRRVEWKCDALNARSRAAAERLGFTFEGIFRQHVIVKGRNRDTAWFSMLDREWPARKANLRRWLDAEPGSLSLRELNAAPNIAS